MLELTSGQRKALRSQAHHLEPIVIIGNKGITETVIESVNEALFAHELLKVRFNEHKSEKKELTAQIAEATGSSVAGIIGHVAIIYRRHEKADKRKIDLPSA
jgi:RNA-binding protein